MKLILVLVILSQLFSQNVNISKFTKSMSKQLGFYNYYIDEPNQKIYLEINSLNKDFLYVNSLPAGVGSNDIGLDRGQLGSEHIVYFSKHGSKILLKQRNTKFKAVSNNPKEVKAVEEAFAQSTIFTAKISAEDKNVVLIDLSDFLFRDSHKISGTLKDQQQGSFRLEKESSVLFLERCKNFPKNTEFEVELNFKGDAEGRFLQSVLVNNDNLTIRTHHSFIELPDDNYVPRKFDPRTGSFPVTFYDYAQKIGDNIEQRFIVRHRLQKKNPNLAMSEAVKPIIYYLDPGTPEPVRTALLDGASWWNEAFEAIGFKNAFQVKMLPDDADPMDCRYNMIQWVHRSTRGWSYGSAITDPRTGEIIKGHVSLGSLRVRQDFMIAEALVSPYKDNSDVTDPMLTMSLNRIRQLSAHEVGHTLGFAHSYAASVSNRASVMDYPHPYIKLTNNEIDLSDAYAMEIGEWDKISVAYAYSEYQNKSEAEIKLKKIISDYMQKGLLFITDDDSRAKSGLNPNSHLWDNGSDIPGELDRLLKIRQIALNNFGKSTIKNGDAYSILEGKLVPLYFLHRYQLEAAIKQIGGMDYSYAIKEETIYQNKILDPVKQKKALESILNCLNNDALKLPEAILNIIPPTAFGENRTNEYFKLRTSFNLDQLSLVEANSNLLFDLLLNEERLNRLVEFSSRDKSLPDFNFVLTQIEKKIEELRLNNSQFYGIVLHQYIKMLISRNLSQKSNSLVQSLLSNQLEMIQTKLTDLKSNNAMEQSINKFEQKNIEQFFKSPKEYTIEKSLDLPPGAPIGMDCLE